MWSPKVKRNGAKNQFYDNMLKVEIGDVIWSFCDTKLKAVGIAVATAETTPKPNFGSAGTNWADEGWLVQVEFKELKNQIRPKDHIELIQPHLPQKYSPLLSSGDGLQSVYLAQVPASMAAVLAALVGEEYDLTLKHLSGESTIFEKLEIQQTIENQIEQSIEGRTDIGVTTKDQLVKSRRGQGVFKANVRLNESGCRITGVNDPVHLRASHIKPWRDCTDEEKLNGCNGLLLAPHVDHLFDRGFISFTPSGELLVSPLLNQDVMDSWGMSSIVNVGKFNDKQKEFLDYHNRMIFKG